MAYMTPTLYHLRVMRMRYMCPYGMNVTVVSRRLLVSSRQFGTLTSIGHVTGNTHDFRSRVLVLQQDVASTCGHESDILLFVACEYVVGLLSVCFHW